MPTKTNKIKYRKGAWFAHVRNSYIPVSWQGWSLYVPYTAYLVYSLYVAIQYTGTWVKAVLWIVPNWVAVVIIMTWIAKVKS